MSGQSGSERNGLTIQTVFKEEDDMALDFAAIKKAAESYGPEMSRFLRDMISQPSESTEEG